MSCGKNIWFRYCRLSWAGYWPARRMLQRKHARKKKQPLREREMALYRDRYRVESSRLRNRDYSSPGYYFVTVCAYDRKELFGEIVDDEIRLNEYGAIVMDCWNHVPGHFSNVRLDEFVVMPNHTHGIIRILEKGSDDSRRDVACNVSTQKRKCDISKNESDKPEMRNVSTKNESNKFSGISPHSGSLSVIIRSFKSAVSKRMRTSGFNGAVWQPRFHDHIVRDEKSLFQIRTYIRNNPLNWDSDDENPCGKSPRYVALPNPQRDCCRF